MSQPAIFISYRRDDALTQTRSLAGELAGEFGKDAVFYDNASLNPGDTWPDKLKKGVENAQIVLVLIANKTKWLGIGDETRRIDDPDDWVRQEVETALANSSTLVIPVLFNDAQLPSGNALPVSIKNLPNLQLFKIDEQYWERDVSPLKVFIKNQLNHNTGVSSQVQTDSPPRITPLTCDREEQRTMFDDIRLNAPKNQPRFHYLYGFELQGHKTFFKRLEYEISGKNQPEINLNRKTQPVEFMLTGEGGARPEALQERFVRDLCAGLSLDPDHFHPLLDKNLMQLLSASPRTKDLKQGDCLLVFAHISHWFWNPVKTPAAALWFIEQFCPRELPPDSPEIFFFFSFDFNENENPGVKDEIEHIVRTEAKYVKPLPELGMVNRRHVGQWLVSNENYISTVLREKILKETFTVQEYYMDDVTDRLKKIINQHLNRLAT